MKSSYYSKKALEHFLHPNNMGEIKNADAYGKVGNPRCGDIMEIFLKIEKKPTDAKAMAGEKGKEIIKDIKFKTLGCAAAIATSDMVCDLVKGKTLEEALMVGYKDILKGLGDLPPVKEHCSFLAQEGLKEAIKNYYAKK